VFGLRSARARAALATAVLIVVLVVVAIVTTFRVRQHQEQLLALEDTAASVAVLEHARAQLFFEMAAISGLILSGDSTLLDEYRQAAAGVEQDLSQARAEAVDGGKADYVATLDDLTERLGKFNQTANAAIPIVLQADPGARVQLVGTAMPGMWAEVDTIVAALDQLAVDEQTELAAERAAANDAAAVTSWIVVGVGGIALLVVTGIVIATIASVVGPLVSLRASARAITSGDLQARAKVFGPEEVASVARDFNEMTEALAVKTEEYVAIANLTGDTILRLDKDGRFTFLNDAACQSFGKPREELLGSSAGDFLSPEDLERAVQAVLEVIETKELVRAFESRVVTPLGTRVVEWNGCPLFDEEGRYAGIQITGRDITERQRMEEALKKAHDELEVRVEERTAELAVANEQLERDITERKQMEEALRESEGRFRQVADTSREWIWEVDPHGHYTYSSPAVKDILGYEPDEVVGKHWLHHIVPEEKELRRTRAKELAARKEVFFRSTVRKTHKDGRTVVVESTGRPILDAEGNTLGYRGVDEDITERNRMEEALRKAHDDLEIRIQERTAELRESEERYRLLAENSSDVIWSTDLNFKYTYISPSVSRLRGYSVEEVMGGTLTETLTPASLEVGRKMLAEALAEDRERAAEPFESRTLELELNCKDGSTVWTEIMVTFLRDPDGKPVGLLGVTRDISERRRMEETLVAKTEEYVAVTNLTREIIAKVDEEGRWAFLNDAACEFFGKPREELLRTDSRAAIHSEDLAASVQAVRNAAATGEPIESFVNRQVTSTGTRVVEWSASPIFDEEDRYVGIQMTGRDITERRRAEEALRTKDSAIESSINGIALADPQGNLTYVNSSLLRMWGYDHAEEILGKSVTEFWQTEEKAREVGEALRDRGSWIGELVATRRDGSTVDIQLSTSMVTDEVGRPICMMGSFLDISERKRTGEALRESEERYRLIAENASDIIWTTDLSFKYTYVSPAVTRMRGYSVEEVTSGTLAETMTPASLEVAGKALSEELAMEKTGQKDLHRSRTLELELNCRDGSTIWTEVQVTFLRDPDGQAVGLLGITRDISERRRMEGALSAKTEEYIATANLTGDIIAKLDKHGRWAFLNDAACQFYGKPREGLLGTDSRAFIHPEDLEPTAEAIRDARAGKELATGFANRQVTPMGIRVVEWNGYPLFDEEGRYAGIQITGRDITERQQMEDALRESEEQYRAIFQQAADSILLIDAETGAFVQFNDRAHQSLGYTREEFEKLKIPDIEVIESPDEVAKHLERIVKKEADTFETKQRTKSGEIRNIEVRSKAISIRGKDLIQAIWHDITARKQMEEAVRESEGRYRLLAENTSDLIWTMDLGLRYTYMSPSVERMRGYSAEEIVGTTVAETMTPASLEVARKTLLEELALEREKDQKVPSRKPDPFRSRKLELEMYCKDGSTIWTEMNMTFLREPDGRPVGILGVTRDISQRKRAEEEREKLNAELEVRAITDSLTGLYDHAHFYQRLAEEIERSERYNHGFAVVMLDIDDFKRFNDSRGHQVGDEALRLIAECIRAGLRRSDLAFRYGGDEFAAILPHADPSKAAAAVNRMNGRITKSLRQLDGGAAARLSLSAGVACFPEDGITADELVRIADAALYNAKWIARARDIMGQREDIQSLVSALVSRRTGVEGPASAAVFRPEALHEQQARIVSSVASSITVALKDAGVSQALEDPDLQVLATVGAAAEIKDRYIRGHPERTSEVAVALAEKMGLSPERVRAIRIAGLLHDIGKVTVSEGILNKPGKLTRREFASIKEHPIVGATLVSQVKGFERLAAIIRHHHERFDGRGYPDGLAGEDIPPEARILSVVDVFDALTHQRSYRKALSKEEAIAELQRGAGTQFDPLVLKAFLALVNGRRGRLPAAAEAASEDRQLAAARAPARGKR